MQLESVLDKSISRYQLAFEIAKIILVAKSRYVVHSTELNGIINPWKISITTEYNVLYCLQIFDVSWER